MSLSPPDLDVSDKGPYNGTARNIPEKLLETCWGIGVLGPFPLGTRAVQPTWLSFFFYR